MKEWANKALEHSGLKQAELGRLLAEKYGWSENRSILNKILSGDRDLKADEMLSIWKATGYPIPGLESQEAPASNSEPRAKESAKLRADFSVKLVDLFAKIVRLNSNQQSQIIAMVEDKLKTMKNPEKQSQSSSHD
ncbi:hypothetical protein G6M17_07550 [Agrobacterium tumefaciens]|uniref:hypothetical protein n=1 Tax=Rhizobium/Agrobacterium group TaxID=227290 RepID=UPI0007E1131B|nr:MULTISPECIES: hypothetical protein [Rhizobium/Agrobacterium group]AQS61753.1 hypothetical protein B0909_05450 [Rhizobium rhizogenes]MCZ7443018.1 hypothetical protein [Rhizobium rhizogenes]NSZ79003.1 hypothetical protein [Agrobacterium tumefaciens]OAM65801.1 hypothetical protein A8L48_22675 [Rhizobium rhizogenes]